MNFREPRHGINLEFKLLPREALKAGEFQRDLSPALTNKLNGSVFHGFLIPLLVIPGENGDYEVIDGQHRLAALDKSMSESYLVPCIIAPERFKDLPIILNVEKADNIKDKCTKLYKLYMKKVEMEPDLVEKELNQSCGYQPYLFTLAFAYHEGLTSPSLVETVVKLLDKDTFDLPVIEAVDERRVMGRKVIELEQIVTQTCDVLGISDYNLKRAIVSRSKQSLWGLKRRVDVDFYEGMEAMITQVMTTDWTPLTRI